MARFMMLDASPAVSADMERLHARPALQRAEALNAAIAKEHGLVTGSGTGLGRGAGPPTLPPMRAHFIRVAGPAMGALVGPFEAAGHDVSASDVAF
jgi:hypothetical protein